MNFSWNKILKLDVERFPIDCCAVTDQNQNNHSSQSHWEDKYNTMNQSELKLNACDLSEARENVWETTHTDWVLVLLLIGLLGFDTQGRDCKTFFG